MRKADYRSLFGAREMTASANGFQVCDDVIDLRLGPEPPETHAGARHPALGAGKKFREGFFVPNEAGGSGIAHGL